MVSYIGENFPTSYDQVGKYVSMKVFVVNLMHHGVLDVLSEQFSQLIFSI